MVMAPPATRGSTIEHGDAPSYALEMDGGPPVRAALGNARLVRVLGAYAGSVIAEWALWVAILVYAYEAGGARLAGITSVGLLVPAAVVAPFAGRAADGARPDRVLFLVYVVEAASLSCAGFLAMLGTPTWVVIAVVGVAVTGITFIRPSLAVVVPGLVVSPGDLVAANLLTGNADGLSVLAGPLLASALLLVDGPALVFALCAAVNAVGAMSTFGVDGGSGAGPGVVPSPVDARSNGPHGHRFKRRHAVWRRSSHAELLHSSRQRAPWRANAVHCHFWSCSALSGPWSVRSICWSWTSGSPWSIWVMRGREC